MRRPETAGGGWRSSTPSSQRLRREVETRLFPDHLLPQVAKLRPLYRQTIDALEAATNPLAQRHPGGPRSASNQGFGRL